MVAMATADERRGFVTNHRFKPSNLHLLTWTPAQSLSKAAVDTLQINDPHSGNGHSSVPPHPVYHKLVWRSFGVKMQKVIRSS